VYLPPCFKKKSGAKRHKAHPARSPKKKKRGPRGLKPIQQEAQKKKKNFCAARMLLRPWRAAVRLTACADAADLAAGQLAWAAALTAAEQRGMLLP